MSLPFLFPKVGMKEEGGEGHSLINGASVAVAKDVSIPYVLFIHLHQEERKTKEMSGWGCKCQGEATLGHKQPAVWVISSSAARTRRSIQHLLSNL